MRKNAILLLAVGLLSAVAGCTDTNGPDESQLPPASESTPPPSPAIPSAEGGASYETDYFTYTVDKNGKPFSFRLADGTELLNVGLGYRIRCAGEDDIYLSKMAKSGEYTIFASEDGKIELTVKISAASHYVAFTNIAISGGLKPGSTLCYTLNAGRDVRLYPFDYACDEDFAKITSTVTFGRIWAHNPNDSLGGFAIYHSATEAMQDECILHIWGAERVPHPKLKEGEEWNYGRAAQWVRDWMETFEDQAAICVKPESVEEIALFEPYIDAADAKFVYFFTDVWRTSGSDDKDNFWPHRNSNAEVRGIFGDKSGLQSVASALDADGKKLFLHYLSGTIGFYDPEHGAANLSDQLAAWADGSLGQAIGQNDKTVIFSPAQDWYQIPTGAENGTKCATAIGKNTEKLYDVVFGGEAAADTFMNYNYLQVGKELMKISAYEKKEDGSWKLSISERGMHGTAKSDHGAGEKINLIVLPYNLCYVPDSSSPLLGAIAEEWANTLNECNVYAAWYDGFESNAANGVWGAYKFAQLVYENLDHPVISTHSLGGMNPPFGYIEYQLNMCRYYGSGGRMYGLNRITFNPERRTSTAYGQGEPILAATWPLTAHFVMGLEAGLGGKEFSIWRPDHMFGITLGDIRVHGKAEEIFAIPKLWKSISKKLTESQRKKLMEGNAAGAGNVAWAASDSGLQYELTPMRMMTSDTNSSTQKFAYYFGEMGYHPPYASMKSGEAPISLKNHYEKQAPSVIMRILAGSRFENPSISIGDSEMTFICAVPERAAEYVYTIGSAGDPRNENPYNSIYIEYIAGTAAATMYDCNWNVLQADVPVNGSLIANEGDNEVKIGNSGEVSEREIFLTLLTAGTPMAVEK